MGRSGGTVRRRQFRVMNLWHPRSDNRLKATCRDSAAETRPHEEVCFPPRAYQRGAQSTCCTWGTCPCNQLCCCSLCMPSSLFAALQSTD